MSEKLDYKLILFRGSDAYKEEIIKNDNSAAIFRDQIYAMAELEGYSLNRQYLTDVLNKRVTSIIGCQLQWEGFEEGDLPIIRERFANIVEVKTLSEVRKELAKDALARVGIEQSASGRTVS